MYLFYGCNMKNESQELSGQYIPPYSDTRNGVKIHFEWDDETVAICWNEKTLEHLRIDKELFLSLFNKINQL